jgi:predicted flap endonuclease-1-like 5' DNA nuclease
MRFLVGLLLGLLASYVVLFALKWRSRDRVADELTSCQRELESVEREIAQLEAASAAADGAMPAPVRSEQPGPTTAKANASETAQPAPQRRSDGAPADTQVAGPGGGRDDLMRIEGIGPKIAGLLKEAKIDSFESLADSDPERLREVLEQGGRRFGLADPESWPAQAALAARGEWDALKNLQAQLKGSRRT